MPLKGVAFALPIRIDEHAIDPTYMETVLEGPTSCRDKILQHKTDGSLPYLGMPSIYRPRIPRTPTRRPALRTPDPEELVATPAEDIAPSGDRPQQTAGSSDEPLVTVIVDISNISLTADGKAANDNMRADLSSEIQAGEHVDASILDNIIDPPADFLNHPDFDPDEDSRWIKQSDGRRIYRWTSELLVDSPMIRMKQIIEVHSGADRIVVDKTQSHSRFEIRFGSKAWNA
eukprot:8655728-Pyramimonas_sp.AAC.1